MPSVYPLFSTCSSFDDIVARSVQLVDSLLDLHRARAAAVAVLRSSSSTIDTTRMQDDTDSLLSRGIFFLLTLRQQEHSSSCLGRSVLSLVSPQSPLFEPVVLLA